MFDLICYHCGNPSPVHRDAINTEILKPAGSVFFVYVQFSIIILLFFLPLKDAAKNIKESKKEDLFQREETARLKSQICITMFFKDTMFAREFRSVTMARSQEVLERSN